MRIQQPGAPHKPGAARPADHGPPGSAPRTPPRLLVTFWPSLSILVLLFARPAAADLHVPQVSPFLPLHVARGLEGLDPMQSTGLAQRAIDDEEPPKKKPEEAIPAEPVVPPAAEQKLEPEAVERKSPAKAFLFSALLPGTGELYVGSPRGYVFLGVEAATWITYASYKSSSNNKEEEMFAFADDHFSIAAFEDNCVGQPGQPCAEALQQINNFYAFDRPEYYEIISKNPIYKPGWGVTVDSQGDFTYENGPPPAEGTDDFRSWVSNQAAKQDEHYSSYNETRDDRNSLDKTARGMTMVALVNHLVSAWDAFALARGFNANLPGETEMKVKLRTSLGNPGASLTFKRHF